MTTKNWLIGLFAFGFAVGFLIVGMALMASATDSWYVKVMAQPHYRAMLVDYTAEGDTVTLIEFVGNQKPKITHEP